MFGLGADEDNLMLFDDFGETRVFRQKAVTRMDCIGIADFGCRDNRGDIEVTVLGGRRPYANRLIGEANVHRVGIGS